jgi:phage gp36-like protein
MSSYITKQNLIDELGEQKLLELADDAGTADVGDLSDDEGENGQRLNNRIDRAISYAVGTFDSYARTRYTIPVPVTIKVVSTCIALAVFNLYQGRPVGNPKEGVYAVKKDAHDTAMRYLVDVSKGAAALDVPSKDETVLNPASPDEVLRGSSKTEAVFSDSKLKGY